MMQRLRSNAKACLGGVLGASVLTACHGAPPPKAPPPPVVAPPPVALDLPSPTDPGHHARIALGPAPANEDNWSDLFVPGVTDAEKQLCERAVSALQEAFQGMGLVATVLTGCTTTELPPRLSRGAPYHLLINPEPSSSSVVMIDGLLGGTAPPAATSTVKITEYTRHGSAEECQGVLSRLAEQRVVAAREMAAQLATWQAEQLAQLELQRENACQQAAEVSQRCKRKGGAKSRCQAELATPERLCADTTKLIETVRASQTVPEPEPEPLLASCVPG